jgi:hypothetical protein
MVKTIDTIEHIEMLCIKYVDSLTKTIENIEMPLMVSIVYQRV